MKFMELGGPEHPAVILLHGGGLSWWSVEETARLLQKRYYVVMPVIDGHGEDGENTFISIEDSAEKLIRFADRRTGGHVFALCGLSLGAQIAAQAISDRTDLAEYAVLESALVQPGYGQGRRIPSSLLRLSHGLLRRRWFAKLQARAESLPEGLFEPYFRDTGRISLRSLENILKGSGNFRIPASLRNTKAKTLILAGSRESAEMKLSAGLLKKIIPESRLVIARGMRHGELSISHSAEYVRLLEQFFSGADFPEGLRRDFRQEGKKD